MQHGLMGDGHITADRQAVTARIEAGIMGNMQHRVVLHADPVANADLMHVATNHGAGPDRTVCTQYDITNDLGRLVHPATFTALRGLVFEGANPHLVHSSLLN